MPVGYQPGTYQLPGEYRIRVQGRLEEGRSPRWSGMDVSAAEESDGCTVSTLTGVLPDQATLACILSTLYDFGFALLSVEYLPIARPDGLA